MRLENLKGVAKIPKKGRRNMEAFFKKVTEEFGTDYNVKSLLLELGFGFDENDDYLTITFDFDCSEAAFNGKLLKIIASYSGYEFIITDAHDVSQTITNTKLDFSQDSWDYEVSDIATVNKRIEDATLDARLASMSRQCDTFSGKFKIGYGDGFLRELKNHIPVFKDAYLGNIRGFLERHGFEFKTKHGMYKVSFFFRCYHGGFFEQILNLLKDNKGVGDYCLYQNNKPVITPPLATAVDKAYKALSERCKNQACPCPCNNGMSDDVKALTILSIYYTSESKEELESLYELATGETFFDFVKKYAEDETEPASEK